MDNLDEHHDSLWILTIAPTVWAVHLLLSYVTAAVWCAKFAGRDGTLHPIRITIVVYTIIALVPILATAWRGWRRHELGTATLPHDFDTREDRHSFLGFATVLLAILSAVATLYVAMTVLFIGSCR